MFRRILSSLFGRRPTPMSTPAFVLPKDSDCTQTATGLRYQAVTEGAGRQPSRRDTVTVHYAGWLTDGTLFDASYSRGQTISFPLDRVIPGWTEGLQLMKVGSTYRFVIPPELGYGSRGAPPVIGPNATLVFHVELVDVA